MKIIYLFNNKKHKLTTLILKKIKRLYFSLVKSENKLTVIIFHVFVCMYISLYVGVEIRSHAVGIGSLCILCDFWISNLDCQRLAGRSHYSLSQLAIQETTILNECNNIWPSTFNILIFLFLCQIFYSDFEFIPIILAI